MKQYDVEILSSKVHDAWWKEKKLQGFHAPLECPHNNFETDKFTKTCNHCHADMYPYSELPENIKNYDRVMVKTILQAIAELDKDEEGER